MADIAWISPLRFASAGDEKVARVFDAPGGYVESLASLGVVSGDVTADSVSERFPFVSWLTTSRVDLKEQQFHPLVSPTERWVKVSCNNFAKGHKLTSRSRRTRLAVESHSE